jgi:hypothetical protein
MANPTRGLPRQVLEGRGGRGRRRWPGVPFPAAILLCAVLAATHASGQNAPVAVMVGGDAESDACGASAAVAAIATRLNVRSGPGPRHPVVDKLAAGSGITICEEKAEGPDGRWFGIVYGKAGQDCGTGTPAAVRSSYKGPCRSGWVSAAFVTGFRE